MAFTITPEMLEDVGVDPTCADFKTFSAEWPDGADITAENIARARELNLLWTEAIDCLPGLAREAFHRSIGAARQAHTEAKRRVWRAYDEAIAEARNAFKDDMAKIRKPLVDGGAEALLDAANLAAAMKE